MSRRIQLTDQELRHLANSAKASALFDSSEYDSYGAITEAFILHKRPLDRYTIFPQLRIPWPATEPNQDTQPATSTAHNPDTNKAKKKLIRFTLPDFCLGRYYQEAPYIRIQCGVEVKKCPQGVTWDPQAPQNNVAKVLIVNALQSAIMQAEDQAKSAVKNKMIADGQALTWMLFAGPYFALISLGPFRPEQQEPRKHMRKPALSRYLPDFRNAPEPPQFSVYLLGTREGEEQLEQFIANTSHFLPQA